MRFVGSRLMSWRCTVREDLDDDHAAAAAWTGRLAGIGGGRGGIAFRFCNGEQLAGTSDVVGARAFGEQAVVADAVQAFWQHMDEEAADELEGPKRHALVPIVALDPGIFPLEGDALLVDGDQAVVTASLDVRVQQRISLWLRPGAQRWARLLRPTLQ